MNIPADKQPLTLVVHWSRFGPYHVARLRAAFHRLQAAEVRVVGLETASRDETYQWRPENQPTDFERCVVIPGRAYHEVTPFEMWHGVFRRLNCINPNILAIAGYSLPDAWGILAWGRLHRCPIILMSESKADDMPRFIWKEWIKRGILRQFVATLCGGSLQRSYLEQLGVPAERIFEGYDAVDNDYFSSGAERARQHPCAVKHLPGLDRSEPFFLASARFIPRKNLDGLLRAYGQYRRRLTANCGGQVPWRLVILGDGTEKEALQKLADDLELVDVSWPGFRQIDELSAYYGLARVFIHPARQEQWGLVVNEAMAAGLPVLVSNRCGCAPDLVVENKNGFTFDPDDTSGLADLMLRVSSGQIDLQTMSRASRAQVSHWGLDRFAEGLHKALQVALS